MQCTIHICMELSKHLLFLYHYMRDKHISLHLPNDLSRLTVDKIRVNQKKKKRGCELNQDDHIVL
jgi:hypothetical protein